MDLNLLKTFVTVAKLGSFTKAAQALQQPRSRVSRAIARLELDLETQLIRRTTRTMSLTESGQQLFQNMHPLLHSMQQEIKNLTGQSKTIAGRLKLSCPEDFGQRILTPAIPLFLEQYPDLYIDVVFDNSYLDLIQHEIDIAFRIGALQDSSLRARKLGTLRVILVASPQYLETYGRPQSMADLSHHELLSFHNEKKAQDIIRREFETLSLQPRLTGNHFSLLYRMALEGKGIATLPDFYIYEELKTGQLERVLKDWNTSSFDVHAIYPPTQQIPLKTRTFIDFILDYSKDIFT